MIVAQIRRSNAFVVSDIYPLNLVLAIYEILVDISGALCHRETNSLFVLVLLNWTSNAARVN